MDKGQGSIPSVLRYTPVERVPTKGTPTVFGRTLNSTSSLGAIRHAAGITTIKGPTQQKISEDESENTHETRRGGYERPRKRNDGPMHRDIQNVPHGVGYQQ